MKIKKPLNFIPELLIYIFPIILLLLLGRYQILDEALLSNPLIPWNWLFGTTFHFQSRHYAEVGLKQALESGDTKQFGKFLHILQDTYSHKGYGFPFGHLFAGTKPDIYCEKNPRDTQMRYETKFWLKQYEKNIGHKFHPSL